MGLFRALTVGLFILAVPLALLATNIRFAASEHRVYDYSIRRYGAAEASGIPEAELLRANREVIRYFQTDKPGPLRIEVRNSGDEALSLFSARETTHMADVRDLFRALFRVQEFALAAVLVMAITVLAGWGTRGLATAALLGSALTVGLVGVAGGLALVSFHAAWDQFHFLAFANDFWRLDPSRDHLIQMFPEPFWRDVSLFVGGLTLAEALLLGLSGGFYLLLRRQKLEEDAGQNAAASRPAASRSPHRHPVR